MINGTFLQMRLEDVKPYERKGSPGTLHGLEIEDRGRFPKVECKHCWKHRKSRAIQPVSEAWGLAGGSGIWGRKSRGWR